jgi:SAM-dependent methyltransferase
VSIATFYAWLSRFQDVARLVGHDTGQRELTVHRRLADASGAPSGDIVHGVMFEALQSTGTMPAVPVVLDAGCGLGGTTFFLRDRTDGGRYCGLTLSPAQRDRAEREARRRGLAGACQFVLRSYDADLRDLLPDGADLVVAIESLAHAPDPAETLAHVAALLRAGGRLVIVDDMPRPGLPLGDPDFEGFRAGWMCPAVASAETLREACRRAGLVICAEVDLTPRVPLRDPRGLAHRLTASTVARTAFRWTPARTFLDSLHGGLLLERLYARGLMEYRVIVARRPPQP